MYIVLAFLMGVSVVISMVINGSMAKELGAIRGARITFMIASLASIVLFLIAGSGFDIGEIISTPIYYYSGALFGVLALILLNYSVPKLPAIYIVVLPFAGQIIVSSLLDYFLMASVSSTRLIGAGLLVIGLSINSYIDLKSQVS